MPLDTMQHYIGAKITRCLKFNFMLFPQIIYVYDECDATYFGCNYFYFCFKQCQIFVGM